jgi:hypothetical protein
MAHSVRRFYAITRDLHLYVGLFLSPLILLFAISVFFLVHTTLPGSPRQPEIRTVRDLRIPSGVEALKGREQIDALRPMLDALGVHGEVSFVRHVAKENRLVIPVTVPGHEMSVDLNLETRLAVISDRAPGAWNAMVYLHKMPGQHLANLRGNWVWMRIWKYLADGTVYLTMFVSITGIYLWAVLRAERRIGLSLTAAGALSLIGLVYALAH